MRSNHCSRINYEITTQGIQLFLKFNTAKTDSDYKIDAYQLISDISAYTMYPDSDPHNLPDPPKRFSEISEAQIALLKKEDKQVRTAIISSALEALDQRDTPQTTDELLDRSRITVFDTLKDLDFDKINNYLTGKKLSPENIRKHQNIISTSMRASAKDIQKANNERFYHQFCWSLRTNAPALYLQMLCFNERIKLFNQLTLPKHTCFSHYRKKLFANGGDLEHTYDIQKDEDLAKLTAVLRVLYLCEVITKEQAKEIIKGVQNKQYCKTTDDGRLDSEASSRRPSFSSGPSRR